MMDLEKPMWMIENAKVRKECKDDEVECLPAFYKAFNYCRLGRGVLDIKFSTKKRPDMATYRGQAES